MPAARSATPRASAPELLIRIKKKPDGSAALSCTRPDGSTTWQRQEGKLTNEALLAECQVARVRAMRSERFARWNALDTGAALELPLLRAAEPHDS